MDAPAPAETITDPTPGEKSYVTNSGIRDRTMSGNGDGKRKYESVVELKKAIENGDIDITELTAFDCKRELFINSEGGFTVFSAYYGTHNACDDVCALLGIPLPEQV